MKKSIVFFSVARVVIEKLRKWCKKWVAKKDKEQVWREWEKKKHGELRSKTKGATDLSKNWIRLEKQKIWEWEKFPAKMVPRILTDEQKSWLHVSLDLLNNREMFDRIIFGDATLCFQNLPTSSNTWLHYWKVFRKNISNNVSNNDAIVSQNTWLPKKGVVWSEYWQTNFAFTRPVRVLKCHTSYTVDFNIKQYI